MTPVQARMARAAVRLTIEELARQSGIAAAAIEAIEAGEGTPDPRALAGLGGTFETLGVSLVGQHGVAFDAARQHAAIVPLERLNSANDE